MKEYNPAVMHGTKSECLNEEEEEKWGQGFSKLVEYAPTTTTS